MSLRVHFYGHSSLCLETADEAIFFHPNFSPKNLCLKRKPLPLPPPTLLDKVHTIVLGSGHFHHCDIPSFKFFSTHTSVLCPLGLGAFLSRHLPNPVIELHNKGDTPYRNLRIRAMAGKTTAKWLTAEWLRPFRGSDQLNFLLDWQGKTLFFCFHPTLEQASPLGKDPIDCLFLSLDEKPWQETLFGKTAPSPEILKIAREFRQTQFVIPIGWGGFWKKSEGPRLLSASELAPKLLVISPGQSIEI